MLRNYLILFILFILQWQPSSWLQNIRTVLAQKPFQVYVSSYDLTHQVVHFCEGIRQESLSLSYAISNVLYKTDPFVVIDSMKFICDTTVFELPIAIKNHTIGQGFLTSGIRYTPTVVGDDTVIVRVYYGPYYSDGIISVHSKNSPNIGLLGYTTNMIKLPGGFAIGSSNVVIKNDTLHDYMDYIYEKSISAQYTGVNNAIRLVTCGDIQIDSIYFVGDMSEFSFSAIPSQPVQLAPNDTLVISYTFIPAIVGRTPHNVVFRTSTGEHLVWSFEYEVVAKQGVYDKGIVENTSFIYPNPATNQCTI